MSSRFGLDPRELLLVVLQLLLQGIQLQRKFLRNGSFLGWDVRLGTSCRFAQVGAIDVFVGMLGVGMNMLAGAMVAVLLIDCLHIHTPCSKLAVYIRGGYQCPTQLKSRLATLRAGVDPQLLAVDVLAFLVLPQQVLVADTQFVHGCHQHFNLFSSGVGVVQQHLLQFPLFVFQLIATLSPQAAFRQLPFQLLVPVV